jgi:phytoene dehydrogenase-like protein
MHEQNNVYSCGSQSACIRFSPQRRMQIVTNKWLRSFIDLECYVLSGMLAKDTICAEMAYMFMERNKPGSTIDYPMGGSGAFVDALVRGITKNGGSVMLRTAVQEVLVEHGRAAGVLLKSSSPEDAPEVRKPVALLLRAATGGMSASAVRRPRLVHLVAMPDHVHARLHLVATEDRVCTAVAKALWQAAHVFGCQVYTTPRVCRVVGDRVNPAATAEAGSHGSLQACAGARVGSVAGAVVWLQEHLRLCKQTLSVAAGQTSGDLCMQVIRARKAVVSNASIWDTQKLLPEGVAPPEWAMEASKTPTIDSFVHLHLGIDASDLPEDLECHHLIVNDWSNTTAEQNVVIVSIPTVFDPSLAPDGKAVVHAYAAANEPWELWEGVQRGTEEYTRLKKERSEVLWKALERVRTPMHSTLQTNAFHALAAATAPAGGQPCRCMPLHRPQHTALVCVGNPRYPPEG